ncbi:hypothetical protein G6F43_013152 [Rhizopus delemar]|nr:hypothetical protein G6F43_013152 [Rhizopus delemar]
MPPTPSTAVIPVMIDPTAPIMDAMTDLAGRSSLETPTTREHRRSRRHIDWTVNNWMNVIWSDEAKINRFGSDGKSYAWKVPGQPLKKRHVRETVKHGGGSIMVWSCISWYGPGYIVDVVVFGH